MFWINQPEDQTSSIKDELDKKQNSTKCICHHSINSLMLQSQSSTLLSWDANFDEKVEGPTLASQKVERYLVEIFADAIEAWSN